MTESPNFQTDMRRLLRERALDAARDLACSEGWSAVNMSSVAARIGVSRPVLYKEIGPKQVLAAALVRRETDIFLAGIVERLVANADDPVTGFTDAAEYTLRTGADNTLIKAVLAGDPELLPLLATDPEPVLARAVAAITATVRTHCDVRLHGAELNSAIETFVRITLSHLMHPLGSVENATVQIRQVIAGIVGADNRVSVRDSRAPRS